MPAAAPTLAELTAFRAFADELAEAARAAILPFFRAGHAIENKKAEGFDPVTEADKASERAMRTLIAARFPDHGVLGEEEAAIPARGGFTWCLDPIDGTRQFIAGLPLWGVLIALLYEGRPVLGVIDQPYLGERFRGWLGADGRGADLVTANGVRPLRTRACAALAAAHIGSTDPFLFTGAEAERFARLRAGSRMQRYGGDCYGYAMVALGGLDAVIESRLAPWDVAALIPVVEGAGGSFTDWRGGRLDGAGALLSPQTRVQALACGDARVREEAIALLAQT